MMVDEFEDPLDKEYECPQCGGQGVFFEGPFDGEGGMDYDQITCFTCKGTGSVEPTHHPGKDGEGARSTTMIDIRDKDHRRDYDYENALPHDRVIHTPGRDHMNQFLNPYRFAFRRDSPMKQTRVPLVSDEEMAAVDPNLRQLQIPAVYLREKDGQPSNTGFNITGSFHPLFTRSSPMTLAWRLLKHG